MRNDLEHKLYVGFRGAVIRVAPWFASGMSRRGESGARANADRLGKTERSVHHFIVRKMAQVKIPITADAIADELQMPIHQVQEIIAKLERLKTFLYRSDRKAVDWAYPLAIENTGFRMTASSGEQFFAA